jgi:hypothetical protein
MSGNPPFMQKIRREKTTQHEPLANYWLTATSASDEASLRTGRFKASCYLPTLRYLTNPAASPARCANLGSDIICQ